MKIEIFSRCTGVLRKAIVDSINKGKFYNWRLHYKSYQDSNKLLFSPKAGCTPLQVCISNTKYSVEIIPQWWSIGLERGNENLDKIKGYYIGKISEMLLTNFSDKISKLEVTRW